MSVNFEFNAPQFFNTADDPDADKFFDVPVNVSNMKESVKETELDSVESENKDPVTGKIEVADKEKSPNSRKVLNEIGNNENQNEAENVKHRVVTIVNEDQLLKELESLHIGKPSSCKKIPKTPFKKTDMFDGIEIERPLPKKHSMFTRLDCQLRTPILKLRNRCVTKSYEDTGDTFAKKDMVSPINIRKSAAVKRKGSPLSGKKKFVSLAERIQHFHFDTPDRFRTIPKQSIVPENIKLRQTVPKTPVLSARFRHRPVNFPNEKEREEMELEEMKKHQVKAYPLNEKILKGPSLNIKAAVEKKPTTVPEPFKLTEAKKKEQHHSPVFVFKAQPLPTTILNGPVGVPPKKISKPTVPMTPNIRVPVRFTIIHGSAKKGSNPDLTMTPKATKVEPFSFDQRMKEMLIKKEENIKKVIEEERRAHSSFKANPLPNYLVRGVVTQNVSINKSINKGYNLTMKKELDKTSNEVVFKARPATVVHQKPFVPVKASHEAILPEDICLNTEKRALERQKFDEKIKKKEEEQAQILKERQEEEDRLEQQKKLEERKLTEFKAKPVPKYKPFEIHPSDPSILTLPKTPRCMSNK